MDRHITFHLVYQGGIANVFGQKGPQAPHRRLLQGDFRSCENFCKGALASGMTVIVWHANVAGDVATVQWQPGPGGPFKDNQCPPGDTWADWLQPQPTP